MLQKQCGASTGTTGMENIEREREGESKVTYREFMVYKRAIQLVSSLLELKMVCCRPGQNIARRMRRKAVEP